MPQVAWCHIVATRDATTGINTITANASPATRGVYSTATCGYAPNVVHPFRIAAGTGTSTKRVSVLEHFLHADIAGIAFYDYAINIQTLDRVGVFDQAGSSRQPTEFLE